MSNNDIDPKNLDNLFFINVEATSDTPMSGVMSALGLVNAGTKDALYARLYVTHPDPDEPEIPVVELYSDGSAITDPYTIINRGPVTRYGSLAELAGAILKWIESLTPEGRKPVLVSDHSVMDAMWFNCFTDSAIGGTVFLDTAYDISDYYSGSLGAHISSPHLWDSYRTPSDTRYPVEVAMSNAQALRYLLGLDVIDPEDDSVSAQSSGEELEAESSFEQPADTKSASDPASSI